MCGLYGFFNVALPDRGMQVELFRQFARKAQIRGSDSWGAAFPEHGKVKALHGLGPVSKWLAKKPAQVRRAVVTGTVIGHTRAASRGDVTLANAHPFAIRGSGWVGAHNGCISNSGALMAGARYVARGETDSEEALAWLASEGFGREAFGALQGWYAMTVMKEDASELIIAVDSKTPFAMAKVGGGLVWHSLGLALESSLAAVGVTADVEEVSGVLLRLPGGAVEELTTKPPAPRPSPLEAVRDTSWTELAGQDEQCQLEFGGEP